MPRAPFRSVLCGGASLAAGLALRASDQEDLFQGFHGARTARGTRPGALECAIAGWQWCTTSTCLLSALLRRFAGGWASRHWPRGSVSRIHGVQHASWSYGACNCCAAMVRHQHLFAQCSAAVLSRIPQPECQNRAQHASCQWSAGAAACNCCAAVVHHQHLFAPCSAAALRLRWRLGSRARSRGQEDLFQGFHCTRTARSTLPGSLGHVARWREYKCKGIPGTNSGLDEQHNLPLGEPYRGT
eukprot:1666480-Rhodomonas_salina.1